MPESKKEEAAPKAADLGSAGASADPLVHQALAELDIAKQNRADLDVNEADVQAADSAVHAAEAKLSELGVAL